MLPQTFLLLQELLDIGKGDTMLALFFLVLFLVFMGFLYFTK